MKFNIKNIKSVKKFFMISSFLVSIFILHNNSFTASSMVIANKKYVEKNKIKNDGNIEGNINLQKIKNGEDFYIKIKRNNNTEEILFSEYIAGVAAAEIGFNAPIEAIKAQMVASTTYAIKKLGVNNEFPVNDGFQCYMGKKDRINKFGTEKENMIQKLVKNLFSSTVILYGNELIESVYSASTPGKTRENQEVWGNDNKAFHQEYLPSVYSPEVDFLNDMSKMDQNQKKQNLEKYVQNLKKFDEFNLNNSINQNLVENIMNTYFDKIKTKTVKNITEVFNIIKNKLSNNSQMIMPDKKEDIIKIVSRYDSGFVKNAKIFGVDVTGEFLRSNLGLSSSHFTAHIDGNNIVFECLGMGHGVGMSQVGAIVYALKGWRWDDILKHYYSEEDKKNKLKFVKLKDLPEKSLIKN